MNKAQIKEELRRQALGKNDPMFANLFNEAYGVAVSYLPDREYFIWDRDCTDKRIFLLLVAEAL